MVRLILAEIIKFKKCNIKYCLLVLIIPVILVTFIYHVNPKYVFDWYEFFVTITTFENFIAAPFVFGFLGIYIFGSEYQGKNIDVLFTYPIKRSKLMLVKYMFIFILILVSFLSVLLLLILFGLTFDKGIMDKQLFISMVFVYIKMVIMHFLLIPIMVFVAIKSKGIVTPVIGLMAVCFLNIVIVNTSVNIIFPWSIPVIFSPSDVGRTYVNYTLGSTVLISSFLVGLFLTYKKFCNNDT